MPTFVCSSSAHLHRRASADSYPSPSLVCLSSSSLPVLCTRRAGVERGDLVGPSSRPVPEAAPALANRETDDLITAHVLPSPQPLWCDRHVVEGAKPQGRQGPGAALSLRLGCPRWLQGGSSSSRERSERRERGTRELTSGASSDPWRHSRRFPYVLSSFSVLVVILANSPSYPSSHVRPSS